MYEKNGRKYFVVDGHVHFWDASPENRNKYGEGFIDCFYDYHRNLSPEEWVWPKEKYDKYSEEDMIHDLFEVGYADKAIMQPTYLTDFFPGGFNTTEQDAEMAAKHPDRFIVNGAFDPRDGEAGLDVFRELAKEHGLKGVKLYTAEWKGQSQGLEAQRLLVLPLPRAVRGARDQEHPRPQGPDDLAAEPRRLRRPRRRPRRVALPRPELHRRALRAPAARGLLLDRHAGAQRLRRPGRGHAVHPHAPEVLRAGHRRAPVLDRRGPHPVRLATTRSGSPSGWSRSSSTSRSPRTCRASSARISDDQKAKILGLNAAKLYGIEVPAELQLAESDDSVAIGSEPVSVA